MLPEIIKKNKDEVLDELVSVIMVARNEKLLGKTLNNMQQMSEGPIEFIVLLDGPNDEPIDIAGAKTTIITLKDNIGRRPATDKAVSYAKGKYVFHIDSHCKTDVFGWDTIYKQLCIDKRTMVIPDLDALLVDKYKSKGRRAGHKYIDVRYKDQWSGVKTQGRNEYTITGNGMGWFLEKQFYDAFNGCCKKQPARWGNFGVEWASKVWLSDPYGEGIGGKVILCGEVPFAHMWKTGGTGYNTPGVSKGRQDLFKWFNGTGENQCREFSFFETELKHLLPKRVKHEHKRPLTVSLPPVAVVNCDKPAVTAIMNTNGLYPHLDAEAIESFLRQDYENKQLIIVATNPTYKLDKSYENITVINHEPFNRFPQQIAYALKQVKTPLWCIMDSDDVFSSDHISRLVKLYHRAKSDGLESPGYVVNDTAWEQVKNNWPKRRERGWWCCLYEKVDSTFIDEVFNDFLASKQKDTGSDLHFIKNQEWNWIKYHNEKATVLHRLGVGFHIRNEHSKPGYYRNSIEKVKNNILEPIIPGWQKDYNDMIDNFNNPAITCIMNTFQRDRATLEIAVNSFLNNDYENKKLLIVNSNPKPLWINGYHPCIEVVNIAPSDHITEFKQALNYVKTSHVSILDDDDRVSINHVGQIAEALKANKFKNIINLNFEEMDCSNIKPGNMSGPVKQLKKLMWWNGVYRTDDMRKVDIGTDLQGFDKRIMAALAPLELDLPVTYTWCRNHVIHESKSGRNAHKNKLDRIARARAEASPQPITLDYTLSEYPEVTVVCCTYGAHKHRTEEMLESFLRQSYPKARLLLLNTHKDPIVFQQRYSNIDVVEMPGHNFDTLAKKHEHAISLVKTPYWMICDDDDIMLKNHILTLMQVNYWNKRGYHKPSNKRPLQSSHERKIVMCNNDYAFIKNGSGWTCAAFETVSRDKLAAKFSKPVKGLPDNCYDGRVRLSSWHEQRISYPFLPGYVWRGGGNGFHLSMTGKNKQLADYAYENAEQRANLINNGTWHPHFEKDYNSEFAAFLYKAEEKRLHGKNAFYVHLDDKGAMRTKEFNFVVDFLKQHNISKIVEFGCGASTLSFASLGFDITSYETSQYWHDKIRLLLDRDCIKLYDGAAINLPVHDFIIIDGPDPPETREESFIAAVNSKSKYIACHDIFRKQEQDLISKYLIGTGYREIARLEPSKKHKLHGVAIYGLGN